jgi:hypothetical protein
MRQSIKKLIDDGDFTRIRQIEYQRARYALVKKRAEKERATKFLLQHPDWEQKKTILTRKELFLINQFYGLTPPRLSGGKLAQLNNCTPQYIYKCIRQAEAKLQNH